MRVLRGCGCIVLLLLCIGVGAFAAREYYVLRIAKPATVASASSASGPTSVSPKGTPIPLPPKASGDAKIAQLGHLIRTTPAGTHTPFSETFTEAEINAAVMPQIAQNASIPIQDPTIAFSPGIATVRGRYTGNGLNNVDLSVSSALTVSGGHVQATVKQVQVDGFPVPVSVAQQFTSQTNSLVQERVNALPVVLQNVTVGAHIIVLEGTTK